MIESKAVVLHKRPFRNTSLLLELFTKEQGRLSFVARGGAKALQQFEVFSTLWVSYKPKDGLCTLNKSEVLHTLFLRERRLVGGLYTNELLIKLLPIGHAYPLLYQSHQELLQGLVGNECLEKILRTFEFRLLKEIGYGLTFDFDLKNEKTIEPNKFYSFNQNYEFERVSPTLLSNEPNSLIIEGKALLDIANADFSRLESKRAAKRLFRGLIATLLEGKKLLSREIL